ncbi:carbohydrate ABC transporter permease [Cohnella cellulosilytica]|uniref:Carbohydrate ABC transporter permease n=1 Tax=Cohnella cellulosilytica TaxID=986710 RepID=A0ABW2F8V0_9BACL
MRRLLQLFMIVMGILWFVPFAWILWTSIRPSELAMQADFTTLKFTLSNFVDAWQGAAFNQYYINTIIIVLGILIFQLFSVTLAAYAFARLAFWGSNAMLIVVMIQIMIPPESLIAPNYLTISDMNLYDTKLAIMLPAFASAFGIFLLRQTFKAVPVEMDEAARLEGCNMVQMIWRIYVPLSVPTLIAFSIVSISAHWNSFLWPLIVTSSPENRPLTVGLAIYAGSSETGAQWSAVSAATLIIVLPLIAGFLIFQRKFINSFMHVGVK